MKLDSYEDAGVLVSVDLVNELAPGLSGDTPVPARATIPLLSRILAVDPPSVAELSVTHVPGFMELARRLHEVFTDLNRRDVDAAAARLNELLANHPAHPHLAKERGRWRLHHHPVDAPLVAMWTAICAEGLASMIGSDETERLCTCEREDCGRVYVDTTKNASRRFCSITCQNRVKAAAFRDRQSRATRARATKSRGNAAR